jgi:hypothetical protein
MGEVWNLSSTGTFTVTPALVPLPAAAWLLLSGLCGLGVLARKKCLLHFFVDSPSDLMLIPSESRLLRPTQVGGGCPTNEDMMYLSPGLRYQAAMTMGPERRKEQGVTGAGVALKSLKNSTFRRALRHRSGTGSWRAGGTMLSAQKRRGAT